MNLSICSKITETIPQELHNIIFEYIPQQELIFINRTSYDLHHHLLYKKVHFDNYVRDMIRKDLDCIMKRLVDEYNLRWVKDKKYRYKTSTYKNYATYLLNLSIEYNATRCRNVIREHYKNKGLSKNLYKKNNNNNKRWIQ